MSGDVAPRLMPGARATWPVEAVANVGAQSWAKRSAYSSGGQRRSSTSRSSGSVEISAHSMSVARSTVQPGARRAGGQPFDELAERAAAPRCARAR